MKHFTISRSLIALILLLGVVWSCKKEDPIPAKSMAKDITSFTFNSLSPVVTGKIDGANISVSVPAINDISKLAPTIVVSEKAIVSPATGIQQDFSKPVTYTVTAEDATTQSFTVTITKEYPTNGLLAYYPFNGNAKDESGNGIDGIVNGATLTTDRNGGNTAYLFNGSSNITFSKIPATGTDNWSMSFWVKISSLNQLATFLSLGFDNGSKGDGFSVGMGGLDDMSKTGSYLNTTFNGLASWNHGVYEQSYVDNWYHLVFIRDNGKTIFYFNNYTKGSINSRNGSLSAYKNVNLIPAAPTNFTIGSGTTGGPYPRFFKGAVDDIRIYKRVLTTDEIKLLVNE